MKKIIIPLITSLLIAGNAPEVFAAESNEYEYDIFIDGLGSYTFSSSIKYEALYDVYLGNYIDKIDDSFDINVVRLLSPDFTVEVIDEWENSDGEPRGYYNIKGTFIPLVADYYDGTKWVYSLHDPIVINEENVRVNDSTPSNNHNEISFNIISEPEPETEPETEAPDPVVPSTPSDTHEALQSGLTNLLSDTVKYIAIVLPIGLIVYGVLFSVKKSMRFFRSFAK